MAYDSSYLIAQDINRVIGNSPLPFDSVYSICKNIYQTLSNDTTTEFDSVYSILEAIIPFVEEDIEELQRLIRLIQLSTSVGITVETTSTDSMVVCVRQVNNPSIPTYCNISAVVWGDGTYTETDGDIITGGDTTKTSIGLGSQNTMCLTHNYSTSGIYSVKVIGTQFYDTFDTDNGGTANIKSVYVDKGVSFISTFVPGQNNIDNITFNDACTTALGRYAFAYIKHGVNNLYLPAGINFVSWGQFNNTYIYNLQYAKGFNVASIPQYYNYITWDWGNSLTEITIPEGVTTIYNLAYGVQSPYIIGSVRKINFPSTLTTIGTNAFLYTIAHGAVIDIPANVTSIDSHAFGRAYKEGGSADWAQYTIISRNLTPPTCDETAFNAGATIKPTDCTLYVPNASLELYKAATGWKEFGTILPLEQYGNSVATNHEIDLLFELPNE